MSAPQPLCHLIGLAPEEFSREENILVEYILFSEICRELKNLYAQQFKTYLRLLKLNKEEEENMIEQQNTVSIINDILATQAYDVEGLANYTFTPSDVIHEILEGKNPSPSAPFIRRVIEIHQSLRPELYESLIKKVLYQLAWQSNEGHKDS